MEILDADLNEPEYDGRRRDLLPWWIKFFSWIFMFLGVMAPAGLVIAAIGSPFHLSLYGLESNAPLSFTGLVITFLYILKGVSACGFLAETDWAIEFGQVDAVIGILMCTFLMFSYLFTLDGSFDLRLELLILVPYLWQLNKIKRSWINAIGN